MNGKFLLLSLIEKDKGLYYTWPMRVLTFTTVVILCAGCGGAEPRENTAKVISVEDYETQTYSVEAKDGHVEGLLGNVTQDEIERVFGDNRSRMLKCYEDAVYDLEEIQGNLKFEAEVPEDGHVQSAFVSESDLGSLETESCMLDILKEFQFSRAPGGMAVIYYPMELQAPYDHPEPIPWGSSDVDDMLSKHQDDISSCLSGKSGVHITAYIGKGGVVLSAGASAESADAYDNAVCLAKALRGWTFADPNTDNLAKLSLDF